MYKNIMFDLDGTVTDSGRAIMSSVEYALSHFGITDQPREKLQTFIGPSLFDSFEREYKMTGEDCDKAVSLYRSIYEKERMYDVDIYDGIPELLKELKESGRTVLLITSKPLVFSKKILEKIGLAEYFDHMVGPDLSDHSSDKKRLIEKAVEEYGLDKSECVMIGDTKYDMIGAAEAGVDSIAVTYGYGNNEEMKEAGATYMVDTVKEIGEVLGAGSGDSYQDINSKTIDRWIEEGWEWGKPVSHEEYLKAQEGKWDIVLTPTKNVPHRWFGDLKGKKVLGLASGGGQQMPIFAALGAECTVLDYSEKQLESEKIVSEREGYDIRIIRADMTKRLPFEDEEFDLIFHPVSNCYVKEVKPIWKECFRVLKKGGELLSGVEHCINYIVDDDEKEIVNSLPFDPLTNEAYRKQLEEADAGMQFSHTLEEQIGGQLEAGFTLLELYEDTNGEGRLHDLNIPSYIAMRAKK